MRPRTARPPACPEQRRRPSEGPDAAPHLCGRSRPGERFTSRTRAFGAALTATLLVTTGIVRAAPAGLPFQGRISVDGIPFSGTGQFRFALVDGTGTSIWSSAPDVGPTDGVPDSALGVTVTKGVYAVVLGDDMVPVPGNLFSAQEDLRLRVWFDDGVHGVRQLSPDQPLGAVPFARHSAVAEVAATATSATRAERVTGPVPAAQIQGTLDSNQLPASVARLDSSPTFTGTVRAAAFDGPGTLVWQRVTASEITARPNTGYLYDGGDTLTLTLPRNAGIGDVVRVAVANGSGWFALAEPGARLLGTPPGKYWSGAGFTANWRALAMSADGLKLVAAADPGPIEISSNGGASWSSRLPDHTWSSVASSADGSRLAATERGGRIWISGDSGVTWTPHGEAGPWRAVASSADGQRLVAAQLPGIVSVSEDAGLTWRTALSPGAWEYVACSADGRTLGVSPSPTGMAFSTDGGRTWGLREIRESVAPPNPLIPIFAIGVSADGTRWVSGDARGGLWSWALAGEDPPRRLPVPARAYPDPRIAYSWNALACSADGNRVVAALSGRGIWHTPDLGRTWVDSNSGANWSAVGCSADGRILAATPSSGEAITSQAWCEGSSAVTGEFVHVGAGRWQDQTHANLEPDQRFSPDRVPDLPATKITSGTLAIDRIPVLPATKILGGSLTPDLIPEISADLITSGYLNPARLPLYLGGDRVLQGHVAIGFPAREAVPLHIEADISNVDFGYCLSLGSGGESRWKFGVDRQNRFSLGAAGLRDYDVSVDQGNGHVGIGSKPKASRLFHVSGDGDFNGDVYAAGLLLLSDERLKTRIEPLVDSLDRVSALRGVSFDWRTNAPGAPAHAGRQLGFLAQETATVLPEAVRDGGDGFLTVNYNAVTPVLVEAIKELRRRFEQQLDEQRAELSVRFERRLAEQNVELTALRERLDRLDAGPASITHSANAR